MLDKRTIRKMKFISDQEGIMNRYLREKDHWDLHLNRTKKFILDSFIKKERRSVAVLGSGWLLDLPLNELVNRFEKILLVDINHPAQIRNKVRSYNNVELFKSDLSGGGIELCKKLIKKNTDQSVEKQLKEFQTQKIELPLNPDAFISLNILNQLDILIIDFLKQRTKIVDPDNIKNIRKIIQDGHIRWITQKPGCIITDVLEKNSDSSGKTTEQKLVHVQLPEGVRRESWTWEFDLSGRYHPGKETRMIVEAIEWE